MLTVPQLKGLPLWESCPLIKDMLRAYSLLYRELGIVSLALNHVQVAQSARQMSL